MTFIILGYADRQGYDADDVSWDGDDVYDTKEDASNAARAWLSSHASDACAEIVEIGDNPHEGIARRTVTRDSWEEILYPGESIPW